MTTLRLSPDTSIQSIEVRNARGVVVRTFGTAKDAYEWAFAHQGTEKEPGPLGWPLVAMAVETVRTSRPITKAEVIPMRGAGGLRAGRGRS